MCLRVQFRNMVELIFQLLQTFSFIFRSRFSAMSCQYDDEDFSPQGADITRMPVVGAIGPDPSSLPFPRFGQFREVDIPFDPLDAGRDVVVTTRPSSPSRTPTSPATSSSSAEMEIPELPLSPPSASPRVGPGKRRALHAKGSIGDEARRFNMLGALETAEASATSTELEADENMPHDSEQTLQTVLRVAGQTASQPVTPQNPARHAGDPVFAQGSVDMQQTQPIQHAVGGAVAVRLLSWDTKLTMTMQPAGLIERNSAILQDFYRAAQFDHRPNLNSNPQLCKLSRAQKLSSSEKPLLQRLVRPSIGFIT